MDSINLTPGIYYQDILADGTRSIIRSKFPSLMRVSYDKRPAVVQTLKIVVEDLHADQQAMQERFDNEVSRGIHMYANGKPMPAHMQADGPGPREIPAIQKVRDRAPTVVDAFAKIEAQMHDREQVRLDAERLFNK